jgi:hypothetical protein
MTVDLAAGQPLLPGGDLMRRLSLFSREDGKAIRVIHHERDLAHDVAYWGALRNQTRPYTDAGEILNQIQNDPVVVDATPGRVTYEYVGPFPGGKWDGQLELQQIHDVFPNATTFEMDVGIALNISRDDHSTELVRIAAKRINSANYVDIMETVAPWLRLDVETALVDNIRSIEHNGVALSADAIDDLIRTYNEYLGNNYDDPIDQMTEFGYNLWDKRDVRIYFNEAQDVFIAAVQSIAQSTTPGAGDYDSRYREQGDVFEVDPTRSAPL